MFDMQLPQDVCPLYCEFVISSEGMISSSHLWGYLADTRGRKKTLVIALVLDGVCGLLSSVAHSYWLFVVLRFFNGFL
jgi:VNT family MFS transporter (synaptic vesicle glycoprotein 2)